jgi:hypothetical protein
MKYDLHIHTKHSDGINTPEEIVKAAKEKGLTGIAITDHDTVEGLAEAKKACKKYNIEFIPGVELTTNAGDLLLLGFDKIPEGSLIEIIDQVHKQGGVVILAHPFIGEFQTAFRDIIQILDNKIDAVEIMNGMTPAEANLRAMEMAKKENLVGFGGSDAHRAEDVGDVFIECEGDPLKAIKQGKIEVGWV